jgi:hypothetical protein
MNVYPRTAHFADRSTRTCLNEEDWAQALKDGGADTPAKHGHIETPDPPGTVYAKAPDYNGETGVFTAPETAHKIDATVEFHPLDHDRDGRKGGSLPRNENPLLDPNATGPVDMTPPPTKRKKAQKGG